MKITQLDTKSPQDEGAFLHLEHTKFGHLMYDGPNADGDGRWTSEEEPEESCRVGIIVRGMEAQTVQTFTRDQQRKNLLNLKKKNPTPVPDQDHENGIKFACVLIVKFVNIQDENGEELPPTEENKRAFIEYSDDLSRQILAFARDRDNFFGQLSSD